MTSGPSLSGRRLRALAAVVPETHTLGITATSTQWRQTLKIVIDGLHAT
jgi:hypothetical protein